MRAQFVIFLFSIQLIFSGFISHSQSDKYVLWGTKLLTWEDFQGPIPSNSKFDALTNSAINLIYDGENASLRFTIETIFDLNGSWKKANVNQYVLAHEQLHFDITEYHSRVLRKKLKGYRFKTFASIEPDVKKMFNQAFTNANKMQVKYDKDTNHSINKKKQAKWNRKVKKLLKSLSAYKNTKFQINISYLTK